MSCARRPQGRSWEVVFDKLMELGECTCMGNNPSSVLSVLVLIQLNSEAPMVILCWPHQLIHVHQKCCERPNNRHRHSMNRLADQTCHSVDHVGLQCCVWMPLMHA